MMQPTPVLLAPKKTWDWKKVTFVDDRIKMSEFYNQAANANKFWAPEETATPTEKEFPPVLIIPMSMVAWITEKKRTINDLRKEFERRATAGTTDGGSSIGSSTSSGRWQQARAMDPMRERSHTSHWYRLKRKGGSRNGA